MFREDIPPRRALTIPVGRSGLSMVETGPRREQRRLRPIRNVEAPDDLLDVRLDGAFGHFERIRDRARCEFAACAASLSARGT